MGFLFASLLFLAAGEAPSLPVLTDVEVVGQLRPPELTEWHGAMQAVAQGETRLKQGQSIMATSLSAANSSKLGKLGELAESPEKIRLRAQKIIDQGNAQIQQAMPSVRRLRLIAAQRVANLSKPLELQVSLAPQALPLALAEASGRLQKQAAAAGFKKTHVVGSLSLSAEGVLDRPAALTAQVRAAWNKAGPNAHEPVPEPGYAYVPPSGPTARFALSKGLAPVDVSGQEAVIWAEAYALSPDGARAVLFLRLADASTLRLLASEAAFVDLRGGSAPATACVAVFRDEKRLLARPVAAGEQVCGFAAGSHPVGSAFLAHFSVTQSRLGITATPYFVIVAGAGLAPAETLVAKWRATLRVPAGVELAYDIASVPANGAAVEVGRLTVKFPPAGEK
jgi:hypothetical protein